MELTIVVAVLLLMFALVVPNLVAASRGDDERKIQAEIIRLPAEARNEAVKSGLTTTLEVSGNTLMLQETQTDGTVSQVKQVDFSGQFTIAAAQLNGQSATTSTWQWSAYPDGTTDSGGLEFDQGSIQKSLLLTAGGTTRWIEGPLPDPTEDQWPAGQLLQRT